LPAEAYGEVANVFKANPGGTGGVKPESIETPPASAITLSKTPGTPQALYGAIR